MQNRDGWKYIHRGQVHCQTVVATQRRVGTIYKNRDPRAPPSRICPVKTHPDPPGYAARKISPLAAQQRAAHRRAISQHRHNCRKGPTSRSPAHGRSTQHVKGEDSLNIDGGLPEDLRRRLPPNEETIVSLPANQRCHTCCHTWFAPSCRIPRLKEELVVLEKQGIIRKVTEPTAWVHPIVLVPKKENGIRLCVDLGALNKCIVRPRFEYQTPFQAVRTIPPGMKFFTVVDALKGYH